MAARTDAQEEFDAILSKASASKRFTQHPDDSTDYRNDAPDSELAEEDEYRQQRIDETMRMSVFDSSRNGPLHLPHRDFDRGRTTGVKGVIADARSFEEARHSSSWKSKFSQPKSNSRGAEKRASNAVFVNQDDEGSASEDEDFLERWRQQRREELQNGKQIQNRRTSPSVRRYGHFAEVDALGYLDAIEKVTRDTVVVVFVYDPDCPVSQVIFDALSPLVPANPTVRFVRVNYEDIEFDNAGVPAILGYKNQGDLFANLTYIIDQIPDDTLFDTKALETILKKHQVL